MPVPSPGKYIIRKKYVIADDDTAAMFTPPPRPFHQRSATLGSAGRCSTVVTDKPRQPDSNQSSGVAKPKTLDIKTMKTRRLLKSQSKKATAGTLFSLYDENFIRYVNELDSYFKASELRHQSSKDADKKMNSSHMTFPSAEPMEMVSLRNGLFHPAHTYCPEIPQISLSSVQDENGESNEAEDASVASDSVSFCTTVDPDWSSLMTSTPDYESLSFFVTPSQGTTPELSCYLTAEQHTTSGETDTYKLPEEYGSQETLFNADSDYEESSFRSVLNHEKEERSDEQQLEHSFSQMSLGFRVRDNVLSNSCSPRGSMPHTDDEAVVMIDRAADEAVKKLEAKVRRSNFVRTSCIDLEDDYKSDADSATVVTLRGDEKKKESYFRCCPV